MRTKKDFDRQNEYNREQYDRFSLMLPKGTKPLLQAIAKAENVSVNEIVKRSIYNYVAMHWNVLPNNVTTNDEPSTDKLGTLTELRATPSKAKSDLKH